MPFDVLMMKAGRAAAWSALARWFDAGASLVSLFMLVRLLGPETYGVYGMALVALALPAGVVGGPLSECLIQRKELTRGHETATFLSEILLSLAIWAALVVGAPLIAAAFKAPQLVAVMHVMAVAPLLSAIGSVPGSLLQRDLKFGAVTVVDALGTVSASVVGVVGALCGFGVWSLVAMELIRRLVRSLGFCIAAGWRPYFSTGLQDFRDLAHFNGFTISAKVLAQADGALPGAIIGATLGPLALGYYNIANRLFTQAASVLLAPLQAITLPVASMAQTNPEQLKRVFTEGLRLSAAVSYPFFIGAAATAPIFVPLFFGDGWSDAVIVVQLMLLMGVRAATASFNGGVIRGAGRPDWQTWIVALGLIASLILLPLAAPLGLSAVVAAVLLRGLVTWIAGAVALKRLIGFGVRDQLLVGWKSLAAAIAMWICLSGLFRLEAMLALDNPALQLVWAVALGGLVYGLVLAALAPQLLSRLIDQARRRLPQTI